MVLSEVSQLQIQIIVAVLIALLFALTLMWGVKNYLEVARMSKLMMDYRVNYLLLLKEATDSIMMRRKIDIDLPTADLRWLEEQIDADIQQAIDLVKGDSDR